MEMKPLTVSLSSQQGKAHLALVELFAWAGLFRMVEPLDANYHVVAPRLPHALDPTNVGQVGATSRQKDRAVPYADHLLASNDGFVEELASLAFHASPLWDMLVRDQSQALCPALWESQARHPTSQALAGQAWIPSSWTKVTRHQSWGSAWKACLSLSLEAPTLPPAPTPPPQVQVHTLRVYLMTSWCRY